MIGVFTYLFAGSYRHLAQVVEGAVIDIEIHIALDAWQAACISMLPEFPLTLVVHLLHIVVGYPVRILVEDIVVEIARLKFILGIDDGLDAIVEFHHIEPQLDALFEFLVSLVAGLMFHIKHWWQVAILQFDIVDKELCLCLGR